jgi:hypothetical protein
VIDEAMFRQPHRKQEENAMVYLEITLKIAPSNRNAAAGVYQRYKAPSGQERA